MTKFTIKTQDMTISQQSYKSIPKNDIYIILDNLRSASNVGSVFRSSETILAKEILLCGITVTPKNVKLQKTAMGTDKFVDWKYFKYTKDAVLYLKNKGVKVYSLETTSISKNIYSEDIKMDLPVGLIFGNEALGVESEIIAMSDDVLEIPLKGYKNSLNVSNAASIVLFEVMRKNRLF